MSRVGCAAFLLPGRHSDFRKGAEDSLCLYAGAGIRTEEAALDAGGAASAELAELRGVPKPGANGLSARVRRGG